MWTFLAFVWANQSMLSLSIMTNGGRPHFIMMVIGFSSTVVQVICVCGMMGVSLVVFSRIVQSMHPHFTLNWAPVIAQTVTLSIWGFGGIIEEVFFIIYEADLNSYDNVTKVVVINNCSFVIAAAFCTLLAYLLLKMSVDKRQTQ